MRFIWSALKGDLSANIVSHRRDTQGPSPKTVVIGVGNILLKDEGIGVQIIHQLENNPPKNARELFIIDGGTCPDVLLHLPGDIGKLIVVDAVKGRGKPGSIYRFTPDDITFKRATMTSFHQLGVADGLDMMRSLGNYPKSVIIIGIEPKEIGWGLEISPELDEIIPEVIQLIEKEITNCTALGESS